MSDLSEREQLIRKALRREKRDRWQHIRNLVRRGNESVWFDYSGGVYTPRHGAKFSLTLDSTKLYAGPALLTALTLAGVAILGFWLARAGEPLFGRNTPQASGVVHQ